MLNSVRDLPIWDGHRLGCMFRRRSRSGADKSIQYVFLVAFVREADSKNLDVSTDLALCDLSWTLSHCLGFVVWPLSPRIHGQTRGYVGG